MKTSTECKKIILHAHIATTLKISKSLSGSVVNLLVEIQSNSLPFKLSASLFIHISILLLLEASYRSILMNVFIHN